MDENISFSDRATDNDTLSGHHLPSVRRGFSSGELSKVDEIVAACKEPRDVAAIAALATSKGGLLNDESRQIAWPCLLGCSLTRTETAGPDWRDLPKHKDEDQVKLDVNRSFIYYPSNESEKQLDRRKAELSDVITEVLRRHPKLCYFQGFHDIVQVILLVLGKDMAVDTVSCLSLLRIRDFMLPSLAPSLAHLRLLPAILYCIDPKLCQRLSGTQPFFALAATLTLYAHEIEDYGDIARLFDFLLAQEAVISMYLFAAIILSRREELFDIPIDEPEMLHFTLSKLPKPLDLEGLILQTMQLFSKHPPERLPFQIWKNISPYSVLKTTRGLIASQKLEEGDKLFAKQLSQLRRTEMFQQAKSLAWRYRRPATNIGLAVLIGVLSLWLRKGGGMDGSISLVLLRKVSSIFRVFGQSQKQS